MTSSPDTRPSWDAVWMGMADVIAQRSRCVRSQVGCVLVTKDNRVAAASYNGPPANVKLKGMCDRWCPRARGDAPPSDYDNCVSAHAEMNAFVRSDRREYTGGTLYCTRVPCWDCAKVVANSGIARLVCRIENETEPDRSLEMLRLSLIEVYVWRG